MLWDNKPYKVYYWSVLFIIVLLLFCVTFKELHICDDHALVNVQKIESL